MTEDEILARIQKLESMKSRRGSGGLVVTPKISGLDITDLDAERRIAQSKKEVEAQFPTAKERSDLAEKEQYSNRIERMTNLFEKSYPASRRKTVFGKYGSNIPVFGKSAMYDRAIGTEISGKVNLPFGVSIPFGRTSTGAYPREDQDWSNINAYEDLSEGFLTTLAKQAGEQRPTDQDVERFRRSLMGFGKDPGTNKILAEQLRSDMKTLSPRQFLSKYTGNPIYSTGE
jgi:hypothetical protein